MSINENNNLIVVKVGTSTLTYDGGGINIRRVEKLVKVLSDIKNSGKRIILVSSGAISVGMGKLGIAKRPESTRDKQALAAIGQCELMDYYAKLFGEYNHNVAQILLTKDVVSDEIRRTNAENTFKRLLDLGVVPIVNENDVISTEQIEFGDNDTLSATVAKLANAYLLIILSDIDGLYSDDPSKNPEAELIREINGVNDYIMSLAGGTGSNRGTGGMITKLHAAKYANNAGIDMVIANGSNPDILYDITEGKRCGTIFLSPEKED